MGSVRNGSGGGQRLVDTLLSAAGGSAATLFVSPAQGDATDAGQIGLDAPSLQAVALQPVIFRRARPVLQQGKPARYELLASASAIDALVGLLQLDSAETLFAITAGVQIAGLSLQIDSWGATVQLGEIVLYRLLVRETAAPAQMAQS